jgi:hypothetical protein
MNVANELACLMPESVRNKVVMIHGAQEVLKILSLYM